MTIEGPYTHYMAGGVIIASYYSSTIDWASLRTPVNAGVRACESRTCDERDTSFATQSHGKTRVAKSLKQAFLYLSGIQTHTPSLRSHWGHQDEISLTPTYSRTFEVKRN